MSKNTVYGAISTHITMHNLLTKYWNQPKFFLKYFPIFIRKKVVRITYSLSYEVDLIIHLQKLLCAVNCWNFITATTVHIPTRCTGSLLQTPRSSFFKGNKHYYLIPISKSKYWFKWKEILKKGKTKSTNSLKKLLDIVRHLFCEAIYLIVNLIM